MNAELHCFPGPGERDPNVMLELAKKANPQGVVILYIDSDGKFCMSSSYAEWKDISWLLKRADWFIQREAE